MSLDATLGEAETIVRKIVPEGVELTNVDLEGPVVVIYTRNMDVFADNQDLVRQLAQGLRLRPSPPAWSSVASGQ